MVFIQFLIRSSELILLFIGLSYVLGGVLVKTEFLMIKFYNERSKVFNLDFEYNNILKHYSFLIRTKQYRYNFKTKVLGKKYEMFIR